MDMDLVDQDGRLGAGAGIPGSGVDTVNSTADPLFPNSFKVTGIKHICDNLVGSILEGMPQSFVMQRACFDGRVSIVFFRQDRTTRLDQGFWLSIRLR